MAKKKYWKIVTIDGQDFLQHPDAFSNVTLVITHKKILKYKEKMFKDFLLLLNYFDFPGKYVDGLHVINLTVGLDVHGMYSNGIVSISCDKTTLEMVWTFMHEVGHHVDEYQELSESEDLILEYESDPLHRRYASDEGEYFAYGMEQYYLNKVSLKKTNPKLFKTIDSIDKRARQTNFDMFEQG